MITRSPTERLEWLTEVHQERNIQSDVESVLDCYEKFLVATDRPKKELIDEYVAIKKFKDFESVNELGDKVFKLLRHVGGEDSQFYRLMVV